MANDKSLPDIVKTLNADEFVGIYVKEVTRCY